MMTTNRRSWIAGSLIALCATSVPVFAQESTRDDATSTEASAPLTPEQRFLALEAESQAAYKEWLSELRAKMAAAQESGEELPDSAYEPPFGPFVPRYVAGAEEYAGTDDAVPFLAWLFQNTMGIDEALATKSLLTLLDVHATSPKLEPIAQSLSQLEYYLDKDHERALGYLRTIEAQNPSPVVQAWAAFGVRKSIIETSAVDSTEYALAKSELLRRVEASDDRWFKSEVENLIGVREKFGLGMVAPNIEGIDLDGVAFSLTDYRGKVVFLDFWGDW